MHTYFKMDSDVWIYVRPLLLVRHSDRKPADLPIFYILLTLTLYKKVNFIDLCVAVLDNTSIQPCI